MSSEDFENDDLLDGGGVVVDDFGSSAGGVELEGWYHFEIANVVHELSTLSDSGRNKAPAIRFDLAVLESVDKQSPAGSMYFHRIYFSEKAITMALKFGYRLGVLKEVTEESGRKSIADSVTGVVGYLPPSYDRLKGTQLVAQLKMKKSRDEKYEDKLEIPFHNVFQVDDPQVANVPKNAEALMLIGKSEPPSSAPPFDANSKPSKSSDLDEFDDL